MKNLNLVIDAPIILSGYLAPYFTEEDIEYLTDYLHTAAPFILDKNTDSGRYQRTIYTGNRSGSALCREIYSIHLTIAILINNAIKTVQQSAKDKKDI
mgnify:FL=1